MDRRPDKENDNFSRRAEDHGRNKRSLHETALESLTHPFYIINADDYTVLLDTASPGLTPSANSPKCYALSHGRNSPCSQAGESCPLEIVKETKKSVVVEHVHLDRSGQAKHFEIHGYPVFDENEAVTSIVEYWLDITERKLAQERQNFATRLLELLNKSSDKIDTIRAILRLIKEFTGFEAVGLRLREGDDFPYYETIGFPSLFVEAERHLCASDEHGRPLRDAVGNPVLECMCGTVISGNTDSSQPFFTEFGSFWTNSTSDLLESTTENDRQGRTRNLCNREGFESVALVPLRMDSECIGLLQLNDRRRDRFTPDLIHFFEEVGASVSIALARTRAEEALKKARDELEVGVAERTIDLLKINQQLRAEIAARRQTESALRKTSRALKVLSLCNKSLVHAENEIDLLQNVCGILVEEGGYRLAWVGCAEQSEQKRVKPVAQAGFEQGYLEQINVSWADNEYGQGPTGSAIRMGRPAIARDILDDPKYAPWRDEATKRGYASSIALPLRGDRQPIGALNIYASEPDAFDDDEVSLLVELAEDLSYGISALRTSADHRRAEKALRESEYRYRELVETTDNLVVQVDRNGLITFANRTAENIFGLEPSSCLGLNYLDFVHPSDREFTRKTIDGAVEEKVSHVTVENRIISRDGHESQMMWTIAFHRDPSGNIEWLNCIARDITERKRSEAELRYRLNFEALIASISNNFIHLRAEEIDDGVDSALSRIGEFTSADRCYLFEFSPDGEIMDNTFEWCQPGVSRQIEHLKNLKTTRFPWALTRLHRFEAVNIPSVSDLPPEAAAEKENFDFQSIKSLLLVPMVYSGQLLGFVGLDSVRRQREFDDDTISLLRTSGEIFVNALIRARAEKELKEVNEKLIVEGKSLENKNIAMREVLASFEEEKQKTKQHILTNVEESLLPLLTRVKEGTRPSHQKLIDLLEQYLKEITSPYIDELKSSYSKLTPRELEICRMIKVGRPSKDIAAILNVSLLTVHKHREQIRKKLGIKNSRTNLSSFLQSL
ncbi:MAG: GAF domain-containing protein [Candidatus Zixiibacteriota bacterium]